MLAPYLGPAQALDLFGLLNPQSNPALSALAAVASQFGSAINAVLGQLDALAAPVNSFGTCQTFLVIAEVAAWVLLPPPLAVAVAQQLNYVLEFVGLAQSSLSWLMSVQRFGKWLPAPNANLAGDLRGLNIVGSILETVNGLGVRP
jgi:hypothetical protein